MKSETFVKWRSSLRLPIVVLAVVSLIFAMLTVVGPTKASAQETTQDDTQISVGDFVALDNWRESSATGSNQEVIFYKNGQILTVPGGPEILPEGAALFNITAYTDYQKAVNIINGICTTIKIGGTIGGFGKPPSQL